MKLLMTYKLSRADTFAMILDTLTEGREFNEREKHLLLNYFAPPRSAQPKTPLQWVAKACAGKKEVRYYLQYVHVESGVAYASDGHRLHWCDTELSDGYYDCATLLSCDVDGRYPDVKRVIPGELSGRDFDAGGEAVSVTRDKKGRQLRHVKTQGAPHIDESYWLQALAGDDGATYSCDETRVRGRNRFGEFVISGMRV
jgi:hypothetical protein